MMDAGVKFAIAIAVVVGVLIAIWAIIETTSIIRSWRRTPWQPDEPVDMAELAEMQEGLNRNAEQRRMAAKVAGLDEMLTYLEPGHVIKMHPVQERWLDAEGRITMLDTDHFHVRNQQTEMPPRWTTSDGLEVIEFPDPIMASYVSGAFQFPTRVEFYDQEARRVDR